MSETCDKSEQGPDFAKCDGLMPTIAQDVATGEVLMMAYMNPESYAETLETGRAVYFSRSRNKLWRKGEESGNVQKLVELLLDCDNDSLCYRVEQIGGIACHTGRASCFFQKFENDRWHAVDAVLQDPLTMYENGEE